MAVKQDVTNVTLVRNTGTVCTGVAIADDTTTLLITPTKGCNKLIVYINNGGATYTIDCAAGDYWAGKAMTQISMAGSTERAFVFEAAVSMQQDVANTAASGNADRIVLTLAAGATTTTTVRVLELP